MEMNQYRENDQVFVKRLKCKGIISSGPNTKGKYLVLLGSLSFWVTTDEIELAPKLTKKKLPSVKNQSIKTRESYSMKVDLHGLNSNQALDQLEITLDKALLRNNSQIEIIHGLGSGKIKEVVHKFLGKSRHIKHFLVQQSNPGITIAYL